MHAQTRFLSQLALAALALLAFAAPASASQVLEYHHGHLTPHENPYLPPPAGPEIALPGSEQACPLVPKREAHSAGPSVTGSIAKARRRHQISAADAAQYRRSYSRVRS